MTEEKGYRQEDLPAERALRDVLNRMNYWLKRVLKGKPLKKVPQTDAVFANVAAAKDAARSDPEALISTDTKAKVALGDFSRGGKTRTGAAGKATQAGDHGPPAKRKLTPLGILVLATGALTLLCGSRETGDFWVDGLRLWWHRARAQ